MNGFMLPQLTLKEIFKAVYPVGCYYWSSRPTNPAELFGGSWERIKDRFLLAVGDRHAVGSVGGAETVTLTTPQIPSHVHNGITTQWRTWASNGPTCGPEGGSNFNVTKDNGNPGYSTNATGGNQPHNNMPPYITAYCWRRTA